MVLQQSKLRKYPQAPKRNVKSIKNWHFNHDYRAIDGDEQKYLEHTDDLICVVQKDKTPLRKAIDNSLRLRTLPLWRYKKDTPLPDYDAAHLAYYKDKRMDRFASVLIVSVGMVMLVIPPVDPAVHGSPQYEARGYNSVLFGLPSRVVLLHGCETVRGIRGDSGVSFKPQKVNTDGIQLTFGLRYAAVLMVFLQVGSG